MKTVFALLSLAALSLLPFTGCHRPPKDNAGGRAAGDFPELAVDVFAKMDGEITLSPDEIKGRNTWNLWCAGTEQFWDRMARESFGLIDLLKTIDSRKRGQRFKEMGLINQPGFHSVTKGGPKNYGLYIDEPNKPEPPEIDQNVYGRPTGIMGFRLFDNPDFKGAATNHWDANRYYNDEDYPTNRDYAISSKLIRPYRVGISCGSCHIAFNPCNPPKDPENPEWENLASAIGNQYFREGRTLANNVKKGRFFWEMLENQPPGTSDTSRIATDHINNPNAINAIFLLGERLRIAQPQRVSGDTTNLPEMTNPMLAPAMLKDGADSVGVPGAMLRVFVNIGSYSQHWLQQHQALIGFEKQKPFSVATAQKHSTYWQATQLKFTNVAAFLTRLEPFLLKDAPGGSNYITTNKIVMTQGKTVFAKNCAKCHSSKQPPLGTADEDEWFRSEVLKPDFAKTNFFSDDKAKSLKKIKTNAARSCATNSKRGYIWDAFSSDDYKNRESIGQIDVWNPSTGESKQFTMPGGGPGYYRTPSLISVWSSAPLLHNNALGEFTDDPSVAGRVRAFTNAMEKMLWPERRLGTNSIWRTKRDCWVEFRRATLPWYVQPACDLMNLCGLWAGIAIVCGVILLMAGRKRRSAFLRGSSSALALFGVLIITVNLFGGRKHVLKIGPIPQGTPVNLIANLDPEKLNEWQLVKLAWKANYVLTKIDTENLDSEQARKLMRAELAQDFWDASKCPDFVEDRGHEFGSELPDSDKLALIEYLKTL